MDPTGETLAYPTSDDDWSELLLDGLKAALVGLVFMVVPLVVGAVTVGGSLLTLATGTRSGAAAGLARLLGGLALSGVLALVFGYFAVVGVVAFAREDQMGAAFDLGRLFDVGLDADYAVPWLLSLAVLFVAGAVSGVASAIPLLGWIASAFVVFYAQVVAALLWGQGYAASTDEDLGAVIGDTEDVAV